ncbi:MAG: helix-turn-helix transcriptional regulator [Acutalibacteraceae bacterium]|nr:helix-turn-helix transcriptional regulator [Acutalibacteraceae bacterium]
MVILHLSRILGEKRMTQAELSRRTGIRPMTINDWYHDITDKISLEHLDRICEVLECSVTDLIEYIPNRERITDKNLIIEQHGNRKKHL